jgi:hypothetical protein
MCRVLAQLCAARFKNATSAFFGTFGLYIRWGEAARPHVVEPQGAISTSGSSAHPVRTHGIVGTLARQPRLTTV